MKKFLVISFILFALIVGGYLYYNFSFKDLLKKNEDKSNLVYPNIVEFFACSDFCPNAREDYIVKIYEGVTTQSECVKYDGDFRIMYGWDEVPYCVAIK